MNDQAQSALVSGNGTLNILNPYCPVDKYNVKKEANKSDGIIQDLDLLYGIEAWSTNAQLPGYGTGWPADPLTNWDDIILAVVNIWASPAKTSGWYWSVENNCLGGQVTAASKEAGQYLYIGDYDNQTKFDLYATEGGTSGIAEMYWTQGEWSD